MRQSVYHAIRGELDLALRLDEDLLRLSRQHNDYSGLVLGHISSGRELMYMGRFASSRSHLDEVLALYDPISQHPVIHRTGDDPHVVSLAFLGIVFFCLGFPDQAMARSKAAIAAARSMAHQTSLAVSLTTASRLLSLLGDNATLEQRVGELVSVATEQGWGVVSPAQRF